MAEMNDILEVAKCEITKSLLSLQDIFDLLYSYIMSVIRYYWR